jgi:predicted naringenin-chalcone synthase
MDHEQSCAAILALGTAVPQYRIQQDSLTDWMIEAVGAGRGLSRWMRRLYALSGITTRYACIPDALYPPDQSNFAPGRPLDEIHTTIERMAIYERESVGLGSSAAQQALADYSAATDDDPAAVADTVTHLIVVSCTGFFAPGLDLMIARQLKLRPTVERTLVGFMGCSAAFNALRMAHHIVQGRPSARVLIVCVELCSLHIQPGQERENLISASLFADGAGACLVGMPQPEQHDAFVLQDFHTSIKPDSENDMVWRIGNYGFTLRLSPQVPDQLGAVAPQALRSLVGDYKQLQFWAIHPGGRAIVDRLVEIFALPPEQVAAGYAVLRDYGNMSSPTILFVLQAMRERLRRRHADAPLEGVAMAFGPGLVIEMAHLHYLPAAVTPAVESRPVRKGAAVEHLA